MNNPIGRRDEKNNDIAIVVLKWAYLQPRSICAPCSNLLASPWDISFIMWEINQNAILLHFEEISNNQIVGGTNELTILIVKALFINSALDSIAYEVK